MLTKLNKLEICRSVWMKLNNNNCKPQCSGHPDKDCKCRKMVYEVAWKKNRALKAPRYTFTVFLIEGSVIWADFTHGAADEMKRCLTNVMRCTKYKPSAINITQPVRCDQMASVSEALWLCLSQIRAGSWTSPHFLKKKKKTQDVKLHYP